jgi:hypothetical protein
MLVELDHRPRLAARARASRVLSPPEQSALAFAQAGEGSATVRVVDGNEVHEALGELVAAWRVAEGPAGLPAGSGLTDDWAKLLAGLEFVRGLAASELTADESVRLDKLIGRRQRSHIDEKCRG